MGMEPDYYSLYEAARVRDISPARVRQMLRAGGLAGEGSERRAEGVLGPWRLPASAVHAAARAGVAGEEVAATTATQAGAPVPSASGVAIGG